MFVKTNWTQFCALGVSTCWLLCGQRVDAQGSFIYHTVLSNPDPGGIFGTNGVPVYTAGGGGPFSSLSVDLNHDGIEDYRVVATGTITFGFQMEGGGNNAVWSRSYSGGSDTDFQIVPLSGGTEIGANLPGSDQWALTQTTPFGVAGPYFSDYSTAGVLGLFVDQTAFAGLQFQVGADVYYGWIRVQEIPALAGGGIVFDYAYDTRPNTPIAAGAVPEPSTVSLGVLGALALFFRKLFRK